MQMDFNTFFRSKLLYWIRLWYLEHDYHLQFLGKNSSCKRFKGNSTAVDLVMVDCPKYHHEMTPYLNIDNDFLNINRKKKKMLVFCLVLF